jgi:hypothetical protein
MDGYLKTKGIDQKWTVEFPENTNISTEKQAEVSAAFLTKGVQKCETRDQVKQFIVYKTGEFWNESRTYIIKLEDK